MRAQRGRSSTASRLVCAKGCAGHCAPARTARTTARLAGCGARDRTQRRHDSALRACWDRAVAQERAARGFVMVHREDGAWCAPPEI
jgi:hypothetical protein